MSKIKLADPRRATPGMCACCDQSATGWLRSGRRDTDADGLTLAARYCAAHEQAAHDMLRSTTIADVAATVRPGARQTRAEGLRRKALVLRGYSRHAARTSANLRGASSLTHAYGMVSGMRAMEADACERLADELFGPDDAPALTPAMIARGGWRTNLQAHA